MGLLIDRDTFTDDEYDRFSSRLSESLVVLDRVLQRPGFGEGPCTIGAELELFLVDRLGDPAPVNLEVLEGCDDPRFTVEINRFNLEMNLTPLPLEGRPFGTLGTEIQEALAKMRALAAAKGARIATIGILPTLRQEHLAPNALTPLPRYRALSHGIRHSRGGVPIRISVAGEESVSLLGPDVTLEGANTSLQFHLKVPPSRFADVWNAAQLATAPVLAVCGNSPFFLGKKLWDETRIALFRQATDDRGELPADWAPPARVSFGRGWARKGPLELFAEAVALHLPLIPAVAPESPLDEEKKGVLPSLPELRLHNGTVWYWNRAVYDPGGGGHVRVEFRALPSGPTVTDMMANGAFLLGLTLGLEPEIDTLMPGLPFVLVRENFHRAAREGLDATMLWPSTIAPSPRPVKIADLLPNLLEIAARGLARGGVSRDDFEPLLAVIRERVATRTTGARWQRRALEATSPGMPRRDALAQLLERYLERSQEGRPVHAWSAA